MIIRLLLFVCCMNFQTIMPGGRTDLAKLAHKHEEDASKINWVLQATRVDTSSMTDDIAADNQEPIATRDTVWQTVNSICQEGEQLGLIKKRHDVLREAYGVAVGLQHRRVLLDELYDLQAEFETVTAQQRIRLQTIAEDGTLYRALVQERDRLRSCAESCRETISWMDVHGGGI